MDIPTIDLDLSCLTLWMHQRSHEGQVEGGPTERDESIGPKGYHLLICPLHGNTCMYHLSYSQQPSMFTCEFFVLFLLVRVREINSLSQSLILSVQTLHNQGSQTCISASCQIWVVMIT